MNRKLIVTGGLGFIGSNFVNQYSSLYPNHDIHIIDNIEYSASIEHIYITNRIKIHSIDIRNYTELSYLYTLIKPDITVHFAAQTHVDNSIKSDIDFVSTNINGTHNLLRCIYRNNSKLIHISTDEVYGSLKIYEPSFTENSPYKPNNPYSASKAASDLLVRSYIQTHKINAVITNCCNNYGPRQHIEKLIPTIISKAKNNEQIPIYGNGRNIREWLYVEDHCDAIISIINHFLTGTNYNIGGGCELSNIVLAEMILDLMGKPKNLISFVADRLGHDFRYSINSDLIKKTLQWYPKTKIRDGLLKTLEWYGA